MRRLTSWRSESLIEKAFNNGRSGEASIRRARTALKVQNELGRSFFGSIIICKTIRISKIFCFPPQTQRIVPNPEKIYILLIMPTDRGPA